MPLGGNTNDLDFDELLRLSQTPGFNPMTFMDEYATNPLKPPTKAIYTASTSNMFSSQYNAELMSWVETRSTTYNLLPKTTYQQKGNTFRVITAYGDAGTPRYISDGTDTLPAGVVETFFDSGVIDFGILVTSCEQTLKSKLLVDINNQNNPTSLTWDDMRTIRFQKFADDINAELWTTGDTAYDSGSIESLDRIITDSVEADGSTFWNSTDDSHRWGLAAFGADAATYLESNISMPSTATNRDFDPAYLDDVLKDCKRYCAPENMGKFVIVTKSDTLYEIKKYFESKEFSMDPVQVKYTVNGLETATGDNVGTNVSSYTGGGLVKVPIITDEDVHNETSGVGNIYVLNLGNLEMRTVMPPAWFDSALDGDMITKGLTQREGIVIGAMQCVCTDFRTQGAVKYLSAA